MQKCVYSEFFKVSENHLNYHLLEKYGTFGIITSNFHLKQVFGFIIRLCFVHFRFSSSCFVVYSTRRFVVCLSVCHFVLVFFSPFSIAITLLGEEGANLSAFRTFVRFVLV